MDAQAILVGEDVIWGFVVDGGVWRRYIGLVAGEESGLPLGCRPLLGLGGLGEEFLVSGGGPRESEMDGFGEETVAGRTRVSAAVEAIAGSSMT